MVGKTISHYTVLEKLGGGGMGVVYKARDTKLERAVALKLLPPELTRDPDARQRFVNEAKAASALQHHNICTVHAIDETAEGQLFICMDFYDGQTLNKRVADGPLPVDEALDIAIQAAKGLSKAHDAGIVHRDIKPANIMVTEDGVVKILDFGLAKLSGAARVTRTGATVGTISYMSPEQARGEVVDHRSDVWSLGAVLYELLTGAPPFTADHETAVLYKIMHGDPEPLSKCRSEVPEQLERIVNRALTKDVNARYQSAADMRAELVRFGGTPTPSVPIVRSGRAASKRGIRSVAAVSAVAAAAAALALVFNMRGANDVSAQDLALAVVDFRDLAAPEGPPVSAELTGLLHVGLVESSPIRVVSPEYLHELKRRHFGSGRGPIEEDQALEVARRSGATFFLSGQIKAGEYVAWRLVETESGRSLGARRENAGNMAHCTDRIVADVLPLVARACGLKETSHPTSVSELTTASSEAYRHFVAGVLAREAHQNQAALRELEQAVGIDSTFALAYFELAKAHHSITSGGYQRERARAYSEKAWESRARLGVRDRMRLEAFRDRMEYRPWLGLNTLREMRMRWPDDREVVGDLSEGLMERWYFAEAAEVAGHGLGFYPDDVTLSLVYQGALAWSGRRREALAAARTYVEQHPRNPNAWDELGRRYLALGLPDSAETAFRRALDVDPDFWVSTLGMGYCAYSRGDLDRAVEIFERVLRGDDLQPTHRVLVATNNRFWPGHSLFHAEAGCYAQALAVFEEARRQVPSPHVEMTLERERCDLLLRMGRAEEVLRWARSAKNRTDVPVAPIYAVLFRARALVALDSLDAARAATARLADLEAVEGGQVRLLAFQNTAEIALAEEDAEGALEALDEMRRQGVPDGGLIDISYRETLANAYGTAGRLSDAAREHEEMLRVYGGHALSHYELGRIYEEMGRASDAEHEYTTFLDAWAGADEGLAQVEDARRRLEALRAPSL